MLILPERGVPRGLILPPMLRQEWCPPSCAEPKNVFGHPPTMVWFSITARRADGSVVWCGRFDDREDADAFLFALVCGSLGHERPLWDLPKPAWHPDIGFDEDIEYRFVNTVPITSGTSYSVPSDCNGISGLTGEFLDTIGGGASGASANGNRGPGGGGGACGQIVSGLTLTPGGSVTIQVGAGGAARTGINQAGLSGTDTWFNGANLPASSCGAKAGSGASLGSSGGAGGVAASGIGTTKNSGGRGGNPGDRVASGGGGAATALSAGANGGDGGGVGEGTNGGAAGTGGGSGGAGQGSPTNPAVGQPGSAGTQYGSVGSGGGGGGGAGGEGFGQPTGGDGGLYGAGGGGAASEDNLNISSGAGRPGLIVLAYTPMGAAKRAVIYRRRRVN